ncbi:RNA polymerase sigma factor [Agriterribacter sp.]|uniref:RNA polymerase sigma factor n=1 Tax=Agriterribacter sp. TaxID=2821509 RepID=UPI002C2004CC|nr:RNA polymerase sigma factor [Agriterribacter sp.]HRP58275.1 RNA polymerase sigma factor [Agriterribacter sp.]
MDQSGDKHYISLIIKGDTASFAILVDRYKDMVIALSFRILQNREEAEEAAQDTFVKIYKSLSRFKGDSKFSTWLYKVTYNTCIDRLKNKKRNLLLVYSEYFEENELVSLINVLDFLEESERRLMIKNCLDLLSAEESFLLTLYYFREHSLKEISTIMGIKENNLKIKLLRSRKKLAAIFKAKLEPQFIGQYGK